MTATLIRPEPISSPIVVFLRPNSPMVGSVGDVVRPSLGRDATVHGGNCDCSAVRGGAMRRPTLAEEGGNYSVATCRKTFSTCFAQITTSFMIRTTNVTITT